MSWEDLQAMTGLSQTEAEQFLEMAGGDLEAAVNLFFSMGANVDSTSSTASSPSSWPSFMDLVVSSQSLNEAWLEQRIQVSEQEPIGLLQAKNGPCGVLAAINGVALACRLAKRGNVQSETSLSKDELAHAIALMIQTCVPEQGHGAVLCTWKDASNPRDGVKMEDIDAIESSVLQHWESFEGPGGLILLVLSCIATHGPDQVKKEIISGGGEPPLIAGPHLLCTSDLMKLLLTGSANGNVGAFSLLGGKTPPFSVVGGIGMLSFAELETGIPMCDQLKSPPVPLWILHSGDHFTLLFAEEKGSGEPPLDVWVYNGLPPAGPLLAKLHIDGDSVAGPAPDVKKEAYFKPKEGEIEDIVQADAEDRKKNPHDWTSWRYEAVLAVDDPSVQGAERPADLPPPQIFELGEPDISKEWRCASCYRTRFQTMCFGQNPPETTACQYCGKPRKEAGWSLWLHYDELPVEWQLKMTRRHAPKIVSLLQTKWPNCKVSLISSSRPISQTLPSI